MQTPGPSEFSIQDARSFDRGSVGRWLFSHLYAYRLFVLYVLVGSVFFISLRSYIPILVGRAFEVVEQSSATSSLTRIALMILLVALVHGVVNLTAAFTNEKIAQGLERDVREELFLSLLSKSQTFHDLQRVGDVMARATNDVKQLNLMVSPALNLIYQSTLALIVPLVYIGLLRWQLLAAPLFFVFFGGLALRRYVTRLAPVSARLRHQFGVMNSVLTERLHNVKVVRNFVQEARERDVFANEAKKYKDVFVDNGDVQARYLPLLLLGLTFGFGLTHALYMQGQGQITFGEVISYSGLLTVLRFPTFISIFSFNLVQQGVASGRRILSLITTDTEIDENADGYEAPIMGHIKYNRVSFRYSPEGPLVLRDLSFEVQPGAKVAVVGPTGSGKTTLIKLLQRLYDVSEGAIEVDGINVKDWRLEALRSQIGGIEQDTFLFSRTVSDNIAFAKPDAEPDEIETVARDAQAHDFIEEFSESYQTRIGSRGLTLSGGQRQRLAIARALLSDPRILTLDDATSAVDSATEDRIQRAIRALTEGRTSIVVTHRLAQIRHADLILVMKRGGIVAQGTHDELIRRSVDYREIFEVYGANLPPLEL